MSELGILDSFRLDGKTALVTGCRRGIGKALSLALAEAGANIIGVSASLKARGSEIEQEIQRLGRNFTGYSCDFAERANIYRLVEQITPDFPVIDILVNNAGIGLRRPTAEHSDEWWDKVINVNLNAQFILSREIGKAMLVRGSGKIIFTASLLSFQGGINVPGYAASKWAVAALTKALSNEWSGKGVQVNAIAPGYIPTDNTEPLQQDTSRYEAILERIPIGRWGEPDDLKGAVVFLASAASDYVTGTIITVDGGWMGR